MSQVRQSNALERALVRAELLYRAAVAAAGLSGLLIAIGLVTPALPLAVAALGLAREGAILAKRARGVMARGQSRKTELLRRAARWRALCDISSDALVLESPGGELELTNRRFAKFFPEFKDGAPVRRFRQLLSGEGKDRHDRALQRCNKHRRMEVDYEIVVPLRDNLSRTLRATSRALVWGGETVGIQTVLRDITEGRLEQTARRAMTQRLDFFVQEMPLGCVIWDSDFSVLDWNREAHNLFGWAYQEAFRKTYEDLVVPDSGRAAAANLRERLLAGKATSVHRTRNVTKGGQAIECEWFHTSLVGAEGEVIGVASMVRDVTRQQLIERQLLESQKLDAIAQLAGGVVHDFNNFLQGITGHLSLARMKLGASSDANASLAKAEGAANKAAELVTRLLTLSRNSGLVLAETDLNSAVQEAVRIFASNLPGSVTLEVELHEEPVMVLADQTQIEQIIINLLVNARDAIDGAGRIAIRTLPPARLDRPALLDRERDFVGIEVEDTGRGMDVETRARIFEPFYSSKPGRSRGLGLTSVQAIVAGYDGVVDVKSEPDAGATFTVRLPAENEPIPELAEGGAETATSILVADDTEDVLALVSEVLRGHGYAVTTAVDGQEAVEKFEEGGWFDLVVADLSMPRKSGTEMLRVLRAADVGTPVIFSSGHADERILDDPGVREANGFLAKPYRPEDLLRLVRRVLEAAQREQVLLDAAADEGGSGER